MLDIKRIKENPEAVKAGLRAKEVDCDATIDRILELDEQRRALIADTEARKARQNKVSKEIPQLKKQGKDVAPIFAEMAELKKGLAEDAEKLDAVLAEYRTAMLSLPNLLQARFHPKNPHHHLLHRRLHLRLHQCTHNRCTHEASLP